MISKGIILVTLFCILGFHGNIYVGCEMMNITFVEDTNTCPTGKAKWRDFTVHLMTKPGLCFVRVTFNARYKREPVYHKTWWGYETTYTYSTVYDPHVEFEDLHYSVR